ncbi:E3 ubiquitin-protein ligase sina-like [Cydia amplana]|uniref:E3 ubiquitin-protein ligase sina-like n=1 Tax=Cydia amplana TaxID=1869771 RepID=UPI002FE611F6
MATRAIITMSERAMECPVCLETMTAPILQCQRGHSLCSRCTSRGLTQCPICRSPMTDMRNWAFEDIISKVNTPAPAPTPAAPSSKLLCPHKDAGCGFTFSQAKARELDEHANECIFRDMLCPLGAAFSNCFWIGKLKNLMDHFKQSHPSSCEIVSGVDTELELPLTQDLVKVYLAATGNMHFIITMKIDKTTSTASWAVQHIGSKKNARLYTYEIYLTSKQDVRRRSVLVEHCVNDVVEPLDIIMEGRCAVMPLKMLAHYVIDNKVIFKLVIKKVPPTL